MATITARKQRSNAEVHDARVKRRIEALLLIFAWILTVAIHLLVQIAGAPAIPKTLYWVAGIMGVLFLVAHVATRWLAPNSNPVFLPAAGLLTGIGFSMVSRVDQGLVSQQSGWIAVGIICYCGVLYFVRDYTNLDRYRYIAVILGVVLLFSPLIPGIGMEIQGASLWVRVGPFQFQPVEFSKILLVIFFASYLAEKRELLAIPPRHVGRMGIPDFKHFGPLLAIFALSILILAGQNDLGQSLLIFLTFLALLYMATARLVYVIFGVSLFGLAVIVLAQFPSLFAHTQSRFAGWIDPFNPATIKSSTFQLSQSLYAIASGQLFGMGPGLGRPSFIPEAESDFIFAIIAQELGLVGAVGVILLFIVFATTGMRTGLRCSDAFGKMLAAGLACLVALQAFIIIGGVTRLIPLTGITLPFVSYGGSSIIANFIILGILVVISDQVVAGPRGRSAVRRKPLEIGSVVPISPASAERTVPGLPPRRAEGDDPTEVT